MQSSISPIFRPLKVGSVELSNRIVMGSMHTGLEDRLQDIERLTDYFVARSKNGPGLIVTGGYSPNYLGRLTPFAGSFNSSKMQQAHLSLTQKVHASGDSKIVLQLLHAGRYSFHPFSVAPSRIKSPITPFAPFAMPGFLVESTVQDFVQAAARAEHAGYDGVEVMGSEGYLIHQFFSSRTNQRQDQWGGSLENRVRFGVEIVRRIRETCGPQFLLVFRIPILDLLMDGSPWSDIEFYAQSLEKAGAHILNSGIGWHESRVPTIASMVPEAAFTTFTAKLKKCVSVPVVATNRFNEPASIEKALQSESADLVSMARPFLADPNFVSKTRQNEWSQINPCIACNQACLDHIFSQKTASCLVNPKACEEKKWRTEAAPTIRQLHVAVVGSGVAGLNAALVLLKKGHKVSVFEKSSQVGGQFTLAARVPGKKDYQKSLNHWQSEILRLGANLHLNQELKPDANLSAFDHVVVATGVTPRKISVSGHTLPHVVSYEAVLSGKVKVGKNVVIIGAGGIGIDVATYVLHHDSDLDVNARSFFHHWGIDENSPGGLKKTPPLEKKRQVTILQRSKGAWGRSLGKTTGWIHRLDLKRQGVQYFNDLEYQEITPENIQVLMKRSGERKIIPCDQVIVCAGQVSNTDLIAALQANSIPHHVIGGASLAAELDAKRAIREAFLLEIEIK